MKQIFTFLLLSSISFAANAQTAFTAGNIVVLRVGDGTNALTNKGNAVFLDEYDPISKSKIQSIALPTTVVGTNNPLLLSGTAGSEGALSRSLDGQYLALAGYSTTVGGSTVSLSTTTGTAVPRTVAVVKYDGTINTSKTFTNYASANNPRAAYTSNGNQIWMVSGVRGVQYSTISSTDSAITISNKTSAGTTLTNFRTIAAYDGQLFVTTGSGSAVRIGAVGTGLPTDTGKVITPIPGLPIANPASPYAFWAGKLPATSLISNVLYVADDNTNGVGGIKKYALNILTSSWDSVGVIDAGSIYRGLTGVVKGNKVTLYAVRNSDSLVSILDSAVFNATPSSTTYSVIAAVPTGTAFRGVALAPTAIIVPNNNFILSAIIENKAAALSWNIENINVNNFIVEKSVNGKDFFTLKEVKANQATTFKILDNQFNSLTSYYRIKAIQRNGSSIYSNTIVVNENNAKLGISIYPNPAQDFIVVNYTKLNNDASLKVINVYGETIISQQISKEKTATYLPISNLTKGIYTVIVENNSITKSIQFVKQ